MVNWKRIAIHCSDSTWASVSEVREWHVEGNGWSDIGYHYLVNNGKVRPDFYLDSMNGSIEIGRQIDGDMIAESAEKGAHAYGYNSDSIGVCLVGKDKFSQFQIGALLDLVSDLMVKFGIDLDNVVGHYELDPKKTCPNIDMSAFRKILSIIGV